MFTRGDLMALALTAATFLVPGGVARLLAGAAVFALAIFQASVPLSWQLVPLFVAIALSGLSWARPWLLVTLAALSATLVALASNKVRGLHRPSVLSTGRAIGQQDIAWTDAAGVERRCRLLFPLAPELPASASAPATLFGSLVNTSRSIEALTTGLLLDGSSKPFPDWMMTSRLTYARTTARTHRPGAGPLTPPLDGAKNSLPVVLLSHGMFGSPEFYQRIAESVAARGYLVAAPFHTDGSSMVFSHDGARVLYPFRKSDTPVGDVREHPLRMSQIEQRVGDLRAMLVKLAELNVSWSGVLRLKPTAELPSPILAIGHSFGAATCAAALFALPEVGVAVGLDAWTMPLPLEPPSVSVARASAGTVSSASPRALFISSDSWQTQRNLTKLRLYCDALGKDAHMLTLRGSTHHSGFNDINVWVGSFFGRLLKTAGQLDDARAIEIVGDALVTFLDAFETQQPSAQAIADMRARHPELTPTDIAAAKVN